MVHLRQERIPALSPEHLSEFCTARLRGQIHAEHAAPSLVCLFVASLLSTIVFFAPGAQAAGEPPVPSSHYEQAQAAPDPQAELAAGTRLTSQGRFADAIPHLLAARGHVADEYAASFNLALCYVATRRPKLAIPILNDLRESGKTTAAVWNLLAQAYAGDSQPDKSFEALQNAAALTPADEKLYAYVADACSDAQDHDLGLKVTTLGLRNIPNSARLHYQRAVFLTALDRFDVAKADFRAASQLAPGTDIGYLSAAHENLIDGDTNAAIRVARQAIAQGKDNYILLAVLGEALIRSGVDRGDPGFAEAEAALEKSLGEHPGYSRAHISLGKLYLMDGRLEDAITQLEQARALDPRNPAVYSYLAAALRQKGDIPQARQMLAILAQLNQEQVAAIRGAGTMTGEHRGNVSTIHNQ